MARDGGHYLWVPDDLWQSWVNHWGTRQPGPKVVQWIRRVMVDASAGPRVGKQVRGTAYVARGTSRCLCGAWVKPGDNCMVHAPGKTTSCWSCFINGRTNVDPNNVTMHTSFWRRIR